MMAGNAIVTLVVFKPEIPSEGPCRVGSRNTNASSTIIEASATKASATKASATEESEAESDTIRVQDDRTAEHQARERFQELHTESQVNLQPIADATGNKDHHYQSVILNHTELKAFDKELHELLRIRHLTALGREAAQCLPRRLLNTVDQASAQSMECVRFGSEEPHFAVTNPEVCHKTPSRASFFASSLLHSTFRFREWTSASSGAVFRGSSPINSLGLFVAVILSNMTDFMRRISLTLWRSRVTSLSLG
jgi:hypothetical protein